MEQAQSLFREGVLSHLEQLEALSYNLAVKQEKQRQEWAALRKNQELVLELRKKRDELKAKIERHKAEIQAFRGREEAGEDHGSAAGTSQQAMLELCVEELKGMLEMHWLTGISGKRTKKGVCVCISTAFEGAYLDSFHLDIALKPSVGISRHSVPPFIPLEQIAKEHLQTDLKKFLSVLFEHLNAYAGRKYQFQQLQSFPGGFVRDAQQGNSLHTVLTFGYNVRVEKQPFCLRAKLLYGGVTRSLPTEAVITCEDNRPSVQEKISSHSSLFCQNPLHRALECISSEDETLNHSSASLLGTHMF
ncbi:centromere protein O isoform X1 [Xenopus tropicalis]|uniref:Centromere protein O n=2 Tax=Xenopus tropicalis TaxID=8364 RepID=CENPO_XENTR|nr:centromere protein O isoform X1 [Xenopus tropicalis]Q28HU3.1 RecName: Full=Centromere protein O; Short=CENP-O [Xenopus tropicalis]CAJ83414.1 novel protein [Xenopus tropicalis]